jgi:hypothetical protein
MEVHPQKVSQKVEGMLKQMQTHKRKTKTIKAIASK